MGLVAFIPIEIHIWKAVSQEIYDSTWTTSEVWSGLMKSSIFDDVQDELSGALSEEIYIRIQLLEWNEKYDDKDQDS